MRHLVMAFYVLALVAGTVSMSQTFMVWQRYRKHVIRTYGVFLLSLYLILVGFLVNMYASIALPGGSLEARSIVWIVQAAGGILFIAASPSFYHSLVDLPFTRTRRILFFVLDALVCVAALCAVAFPRWLPADEFLAGVLFGMIVYGLVFIAARLGRVGDRTLRRALVIFIALTAVFFPLMVIDAAMEFLPFLAVFGFLENLAQPLYFLVLNCLTIAFGLKYLNRPAYAEKEVLTEHFVSAFGISQREREIIGLLLTGIGTKEIAAKLFISAKTADNHVTNIYRKLGVRSRVQMFQLIRTNAIE
jgi:DNA-binding CsgD family transcriptional regulator